MPKSQPPVKTAQAQARGPEFWEGMRPDWVAGLKSVAALSKEYGVSRPAIVKHWAVAGVARKHTDEIREEAEALVAKVEAGGKLDAPAGPATPGAPTDTEIVQSNAAMQAAVILGQRGTVKRAVRLVDALLGELEAHTLGDASETWAKLDRVLRHALGAKNRGQSISPDTIRQALDAAAKAQSHAGRVDTTKKLVETLERLVSLQRRVLNIADDTPVDPTARIEEERDKALDAISDKFKTVLARVRPAK
jgi:hypothetical protein